jgi:hypothetical protein
MACLHFFWRIGEKCCRRRLIFIGFAISSGERRKTLKHHDPAIYYTNPWVYCQIRQYFFSEALMGFTRKCAGCGSFLQLTDVESDEYGTTDNESAIKERELQKMNVLKTYRVLQIRMSVRNKNTVSAKISQITKTNNSLIFYCFSPKKTISKTVGGET